MTCYRPIRGYRSAEPNGNGKYPLVFKPKDRNCDIGRFVDIPCGQCTGCKLERARQWALRCVHELKCHDSGSFVTLTFNDDALRKRGHNSLMTRDLQLFMKRVRKRFGSGVKFMASGEYGDNYGRPHYHAILFGVRFEDQKYWRTTGSGEKIYRSAMLEKIWSDPVNREPYGYSSVGSVTFKSAAYVASYVLKKQVGSLLTNGDFSMSCADIDFRTGRIIPRKSEFATRSVGLGKKWFDRYGAEWYVSDSCIHDGREQGIPKYYDKLFAEINPSFMEEVKTQRRRRARAHRDNNTDRRLKVRETVHDSRLTRLFRNSSFDGNS